MPRDGEQTRASAATDSPAPPKTRNRADTARLSSGEFMGLKVGEKAITTRMTYPKKEDGNQEIHGKSLKESGLQR